ncbi:[FeFe] hydrogenase, group A [Hespellia stercorisuis]|uniref:NADH-quinone oxidoreductase subunit G n=1 Tax=Hespellia stercorisuis DSM 15480 TaxID=1121950 RepID=A0A1M6HL68_9FIRM|nr:[FeFe] hydrogenase, group A [Hespellia stercorisuis]SHJ22909.1 NADH-quinone oxidoreductase subunit G [Hespellia stercorisuis DSM 15480]
MGYMTIDGIEVEFTDESNVLSVIRKADIDIPTLCYHSELSVYGACRLCTVENDRGKTFASCSERPRDGMVIYTNTPRLMKYRKMILELLLSAHCRDCTTCIKSGECHLQELAHRMGVTSIGYENKKTQYPIDMSSPAIVRDPNKCILCGDCVRMCDNVQHVNAIDFAYRGTEALVTPAFDKTIAETDCVNCGQCRAVCPTGAISINTNIEVIWEALADKNVKVIAQIAPAVRVAVGDAFGLARGENVMGKIVNVMHRMGFDEVYDTAYGADLTVMEESKELLERLTSGEKLPLFTSCCPAWVSYCESHYPELVDHISTCRSPMQMFGAVMQEYYKEPKKNGGKQILSVAVMPCTAKKAEILRGESKTDGKQDVDYVLTTTELITMIKKTGIRFENLDIESSDMPFGIGSGAGIIFGNTGGVTEAVLRRLTDGHNRSDMDRIRHSGVRGEEGIKELTFPYKDREIRAAVVSGLGNADELIKRIKSGEAEYDFVEVMACHRGCVMGGGQPVQAGPRTRAARAKGLYDTDINTQIKKSNENPLTVTLYNTLLKGKEHKLLHRNME